MKRSILPGSRSYVEAFSESRASHTPSGVDKCTRTNVPTASTIRRTTSRLRSNGAMGAQIARPPVTRDFGRDKSHAQDVRVPILGRETEFGRQMPPERRRRRARRRVGQVSAVEPIREQARKCGLAPIPTSR